MDAIVTRGITKTYRIGVGRARVREMLPPPLDRIVRGAFPNWWSRDTFDALHDVSVTVPAGSSVGLVGHNGAGKTTFLKVVAGVTAATFGSVTVNGRVAALIDLLVGFHAELTGRENVLLYGALHGFSRREMEDRLERVFDFAEIDDLSDTPIKRYSAGMAARLGFATIASLDVDVLMIDEVLSVGDSNFQRKCVRWLETFRAGGGTLLFVSHNLALVRNMTERVAWLDHGQLVEEGSTAEVLPKYAHAMERRGPTAAAPIKGKRMARRAMVARGQHRWGAGGARVEEVHFGETSDGGPVEIGITYDAETVEAGVFCVGFVDESGNDIGAATSPVMPLGDGKGTVVCTVRLPLRSGIYFPVVAILSPDGVVRDRWRLDRALVVERNGAGAFAEDFGPVEIDGSWSGGAPPKPKPARTRAARKAPAKRKAGR